MILKGFKKKSNKKYLNKLLKVREVNVTNTIIKRLGVVVNADKGFDFEQFNAFATKINVHPNNIKIITFSERKKDDLHAWDNCYYPNDFGWKGAINNVELKAFLDSKFDALISYYEEDVLDISRMPGVQLISP